MKRLLKNALAASLAAGGLMFALPALAGNPDDPKLGTSVDSLLAYARERNPEFAATQAEAAAAGDRVQPAGALADPRLRTEMMDVTRMGQQNASLLPGRAAFTRYTVMQDVPWFGKRGLKGEIAQAEADGAQAASRGTWAELSARIKTAYAQLYYIYGNERLTREILDLMARLEGVAQVRYAGGLAAQQDVVRAQVEQTDLRNELIAIENERRAQSARMNALLSRPTVAPLAEPVVLRPLPPPARLDFAALEDRVRAGNPQLFEADARLKAAEKSRELTYKNRYPDFTFGIVPNQYQSSVKSWDVMVELNIPLQQTTRRSQEREAERMLDAARARKEATANQVLSDLSENLAGIDAAQNTRRLIETSLLPQAELTFNAALPGYETGKVDFATLIDALRQIRQAKQGLIKARAEGQARLGEIERLLGEDL